MSNAGYATLTIIPVAKGFSAALAGEIDGPMSSAGKSAGEKSGSGFVGAFKGLLGPALALAGAGLFSGFIAEAARASDATDKFKATMGFAGLDTSAIDAATASAKEFADQTVYDLPTIQNTIAQLASNGVADYTGLTKAAGNLNAVAGGNADTFKSVAMVMTQTAGAGKLTTENWNQMADAIPGAAGPLMKSLEEAGAYTGNFRDAMAEGEITSEEFNAALMKLGNDPIAVEAAKSTKTFEGAIGNLQATINSGLMSALDALKPAITGTINLLANGLGAAFEWTGKAASGLYDLFANGNFGGALREAFNVEEDSGFVDFLFRTRDAALEVVGGFRAFGAAWRENNGDVTSDGFAGVMERVANGAREVTGGIRAMFAAFVAGDGDITSSGFPGFMEQVGFSLRQAWEAVKPLGAALGSVFTSVGPQIAGILPLLSPFGMIFQALLPVLPQVAALVADLAAQIGPALGQAVSLVTPIVGMLISHLSGVFMAMMPGITAMVITLGGAMTQLIPVVMGVLGAIMPLVGTLISQLSPILISLVTSIMPPIVSIFGNVVNAIGPLITILMGLLIPAIQALMPVVVTVFGVIANVVTSAMQIVQGIIQVVTGIISGDWEKVWDGIGNILEGAWSLITGLVSGALQILGSLITAALSFIGGVWNSMWSGLASFLRDAWNNISRGVSDGIGAVIDFFAGLWDRITGAIGDIGSKALSIGGDIIAGIANGITNAAGAVRDAIAGAIGNVIDFAKDLLGIHSPSRVFMEIGDFTAQGMAIGLTKGARHIQKASSALIPPSPVLASPSVTSGAAATIAAASSATASAAGPAVHIHGNVYGDPEHIADELETKWRRGVSLNDLRRTAAGVA